MRGDLSAYRAILTIRGKVTRTELPYVYLQLNRDVDNIVSVKFSGALSPEVEIITPRLIKAMIPGDTTNAVIGSEISVAAEVSPTNQNGVMTPNTLGFGLRPKTVDGRDEALQRAVRYLLMDPGTDIWYPGNGGGLKSLLSSVLLDTDLRSLSRDLSLVIDKYNSTASRNRPKTRWSVGKMELHSIRSIPAGAPVVSVTGDTSSMHYVGDHPSIGVAIKHTLFGPTGKPEQASSVVVI